MGQDGFYLEAASIVEGVRSGKGRIKSLCYNSKHNNKKGLLALVTNTYYEILEKTLQNSDFPKTGKKIRSSLAIVLIHDLVNDRTLNCSAKLLELIWKNKTRIKAEYVKLKIKQPVKITIKPLRYARVNTMLITVESCIGELVRLGYEFVDNDNDEIPESGNKFTIDKHIKSLLVFPPGKNLTQMDLYKNGSIVLQDKASCMPVEVLQVPPGAFVIDACAAPGNKTTQLAAAVGPTGKVIAFEKDPKRAKILGDTVNKYTKDDAGVVSIKCMDFLQINPASYPAIEYCLVDPSCSGSGILEEFEIPKTNDEATSTDRLISLSNFQFPNLKRIVYSTCSIYKEENEEVVRQVLEAEPKFRLIKTSPLWWYQRGLDEPLLGDYVIRVDPLRDRMNGFFIACFERLTSVHSIDERSWEGRGIRDDSPDSLIESILGLDNVYMAVSEAADLRDMGKYMPLPEAPSKPLEERFDSKLAAKA